MLYICRSHDGEKNQIITLVLEKGAIVIPDGNLFDSRTNNSVLDGLMGR